MDVYHPNLICRIYNKNLLKCKTVYNDVFPTVNCYGDNLLLLSGHQ